MWEQPWEQSSFAQRELHLRQLQLILHLLHRIVVVLEALQPGHVAVGYARLHGTLDEHLQVGLRWLALEGNFLVRIPCPW